MLNGGLTDGGLQQTRLSWGKDAAEIFARQLRASFGSDTQTLWVSLLDTMS
jgi:hypothetical protein